MNTILLFPLPLSLYLFLAFSPSSLSSLPPPSLPPLSPSLLPPFFPPFLPFSLPFSFFSLQFLRSLHSEIANIRQEADTLLQLSADLQTCHTENEQRFQDYYKL